MAIDRPSTFEVRELTISRYHEDLKSGQTTCTEVTAAYLSRISRYNPVLKALITINSHALDIAQEKDFETAEILRNGGKLPPLHGVPIILKDTYSTADMPTTAGCLALKTLTTTTDAFVVRKLRAAGAIILAKANLHELSMQGITISSLGGQTLNPYDLTRTPGGSSGGNAAALAANLCLAGCGGDTMNSLRSPASACSIVGFRPTRGQVSRSGTLGVSETQDAIGPMARTVRDVRVLFEVMKGEDPEDPATINPERLSVGEEKSPTTTTSERNRPFRIGILDTYFDYDNETKNPETSTVNNLILSALNISQSSFATLIHISLPPSCSIETLLTTADVQSHEFRTTINTFLQSNFIKSSPHRTLSSLAQSGHFNRGALSSVFFDALQPEEVFGTSTAEYKARLERIAKVKQTVSGVFEEYELDAVAYPHQRHYVVKVGERRQPGRNGILAASTGRPAVCVPAGFSPPTESAPLGVPMGLELMGKPWRDLELLDIAERFEAVLQARREPRLDEGRELKP
ncbi:hypothetical protein VTN00DRAFT_9546 [Thermoascus crustaceus]|uniref:uncharacterized protein n=1 Tax=Thermoascus crustaceus TaxID=5088 RepID=UPI0037428B45